MELERDEVNDLLMYSLKECPIRKLGFYGCNISKISGGVVSLAWLKYLSLDLCKSIQSIPNLPGNITSISAHSCSSLVNLPCNISELKSLTSLNFNNCPKLGTEDPHFLMKVTGLTNLTDLTMVECNVSQVPSEIENMVSLKHLDLSGNTFSSLPDSLSNLSQLVYLIIEDCQQLRLLPFIPSNLTGIAALCTSALGQQQHLRYHLMRNCSATLKMHNKTKNTSHRFKTDKVACLSCLIHLMIQHFWWNPVTLPQGSVSTCGIRLIYESDVVDCKLVIQTVTERTSEMATAIT
ncbi:hypothetical protein L1987_59518 [Smallanthus sonchifolius]|uniref:Uncharacterized protein n=1 Tax=Smallanthus sonchifolius TaxID=185202 RepID=A0ACB9D5P2_9ASTR|nr:hypothetical protein L1987_59518 [Smallanthus sonchifolius]